ncbi:MAG: nitrate reductase [Azoarcus sp.]|nr:MAG: nitrate reductase [Azoarcus sp.]
MNIASLVVRAKPEDFAVVHDFLKQVPGVEVQGESLETGRIVVTVEDGEGWSVTDSILKVNLCPRVQGVTLAYEYTDEGLENLEA